MPVIEPATSARNFTPSSTALVSFSLGFSGAAVADQMLHGQLRPPTVTVTPVEALPRLALSSVARARSVAVPVAWGVHVNVQELVPEAGCHVWPLSAETSTPPTTPPPESLAVPETVTGVPTVALLPDVGEVIVAPGAVVSVLLEAGVSPD